MSKPTHEYLVKNKVKITKKAQIEAPCYHLFLYHLTLQKPTNSKPIYFTEMRIPKIYSCNTLNIFPSSPSEFGQLCCGSKPQGSSPVSQQLNPPNTPPPPKGMTNSWLTCGANVHLPKQHLCVCFYNDDWDSHSSNVQTRQRHLSARLKPLSL